MITHYPNNMPQKMVFPTDNRMLLPNNTNIDYVMHDNKVYRLCVIKCMIPLGHFYEKITKEQIYDFFQLDEKGIWMRENILNNITVEQVHRPDIFDTVLYAYGKVLEKDYTFYILKWGQ